MAEIMNNNSKRKKDIRIDLTPMVDLGFLLISFFIFTTQITKPVGMKLNLPADSPKPMNVKESTSLTLMPTAGKIVYVYEGLARDNQRAATYSTDDLFALRQVLINKQAAVKKRTGDPADVVVLIKPDKDCSYQTLVDLLDEMTINAITRYAIADRDTNDDSLLLASK